MKNTSYKSQRPSHIVGIGASAGGLEALQSLFENMPNDLGVAFVVIQHLSPDFKSMMDELLSKNSTMPTHQAEEGEELLANSVYLIPSGKLMRVVEGRIYLSDLPPDNRINLPINEFFRSLAEDQQNHAIGIILSGTGSDGSRGILALKEVGALVIVQDPEEAQFDGMPINAINTGAVDFVRSIHDMAEPIAQFVSHPLHAKKEDLFRTHLSENGDLLDRILRLVQEHTDLDFRAYKESTVARRIEHRMSINNQKSLKEYWEYIQNNKDELELIKQDLLIGVTQFFRDAEVWDTLAHDIIEPLLLRTASQDNIRVWCTGCSTGEEAYTLAMIFQESMQKLGVSRQVKVFASDIDQSAVAFAANGVYPASIASEVPTSYISNYFNQLSDGSFQISKGLRSMVVFATHNLIQDPPFSNMDLISCRNTLIYLQSPAQQKALAFFHFALKLNGYLLLGSAETPGAFTSYFETIDSRLRIYQKIKDIRIPVSSISSTGMRSKGYHPKSIPQFLARNVKTLGSAGRNNAIGRDAVVKEFVPATLIFNSKLQLVYSYGDTASFTSKIKEGHVTNDIADVLISELVSHAISAAHQVIRERKSVIFNHVFESDSGNGIKESWSLKAFSFTEKESIEVFVGISLIKDGQFVTRHADIEYSIDQQAQQRIADLDSSLVDCQKLYRESLEDLDTVSEELQSSNEELMAANEELQSTNEELQSVNEELYTVNSEYQQKIVEMTNINTDLENLLKATKLAVLFLDENLRIRRFTHALKEFVNIIDFDIDREFKDLSLKYGFDGIHQLISEVNNGANSVLKSYCIDNDRTVEVSVNPYVVGMQKKKGVVVSMREVSGNAT